MDDRGKGYYDDFMNVALDVDGDGEITVTEIQKAGAALKSLDKDGDGWVRREEMRPANANRGRQN